MTRDEFEYLLIKYEKDIYTICMRLTGNKCEADELFQDTWLAAMEQMPKIDFQKNPQSYLMGKAVLLWKAKKRKFARRQRIAPLIHVEDQSEDIFFVSEMPSLEQITEKKELVTALRKEVAQLKEKYRIVVDGSVGVSDCRYSENSQRNSRKQTLQSKKNIEKQNGGAWI